MIKVSDYVAKFLAEHEDVANTVFLVSGGGVMHLLDGVGRNKDLNYVCNHHEQACTIAAEGFARVTNKIGVALVTTGPGGTNAITGVMGAWTDSIPTLTISGQVKLETTIINHPELRQLGDQEINIIDIVKPITKYAVMVTNKKDIKYHLQKAVYLAKNGRPGPVWIDVPLDIQGSLIDEQSLKSFDPGELGSLFDENKALESVNHVMTEIRSAKRPVFVVGNGVRLSDAKEDFLLLAEKMGIPILTTISGVDLIHTNYKLFFGRPGILGARAANFILQNSDLVIVIGTRMSLRIISYAYETTIRAAKKVMVDIDNAELNKNTFPVDIKVHADARFFIQKLYSCFLEQNINLDIQEWLKYCNRMRNQYPVVLREHREKKEYVSSYYLPEVLSKLSRPDEVMVTGNGTAYTSTYQAITIKKDQRLFANMGCAAMGYDLPAAIGACFANKGKDVILLTGDGSIQMNIQELQTIVHHNLPIKIIMYNNQGYVSIKNTQDSFFNGFYVGSGSTSGVTIPDMLKVAQAYGIETEKIYNHEDLEPKLQKVLAASGPVLCEVMLDPAEKLYPKTFSEKKPDGRIVSKPLEDLYPMLPRDEFFANMIIDPLDEDDN